MTDKTPAMPELVQQAIGFYSHSPDGQYDEIAVEALSHYLAALQSAQPAAVSDGEIVKLAFEMCSACYSGMDHQFAGMSVVKFARAILALRPQADHPDTARCIKARNDLNAALHGEGALIDDLEHAVANVCAKLLRPQAVPMTRAQQLEVFRKAEDRMAHDINLCWRNALIEETEAHHGITQRADGGEG